MVSGQNFFLDSSKLFKKRVAKKFYVILLLTLVLTISLIVFNVLDFNSSEVFVGVMAGHETVDELLVFVDEVEEYVNLIVVSELAITTNSTKLYSVFDYLYAKEIYFMPFMEHHNYVDDPNFFRVAEEKWGKYFL